MKTRNYFLYAITFLFTFLLFSSLFAVVAPELQYGLIKEIGGQEVKLFIDGDYTDWQTDLQVSPNDYYADAHLSGDPQNPTTKAKIFFRYDCYENEMYILFLANDVINEPVVVEEEEAYVKMGKKVVGDDDASDGNFSWINLGSKVTNNGLTKTTADGWEAVFPLDEGEYNNIQVHGLIFNAAELIDGSDTYGNSGFTVIVDCDTPDDNLQERDYGDNPDEINGVPTIYGSPYHPVDRTKLRMGDVVDGDLVNQFSINSDGDDTFDPYPADDEDGVTFFKYSDGIRQEVIINPEDGKLHIDQTFQQIEIRVIYTNTTGNNVADIFGWIDWNRDGDFDDMNENIISVSVTGSGEYWSPLITVPEVEIEVPIYCRFRYNLQGDYTPTSSINGKHQDLINPTTMATEAVVPLNPYSPGNWGEVEDYNFTVDGEGTPISVSLSNFEATAEKNQVKISWDSESEINHAGYNIFRSTLSNGQYEKINNSLIISDVAHESNVRHYEYMDDVSVCGVYFYKLEDISLDGTSEFHGPIQVTLLTEVEDNIMANKFNLSQNYPNPFNPTTTINYTLPKSSQVSLAVYDVTGRVVKQLVSDYQAAGTHSVKWDATDESGSKMPSGVYIYQVNTEEYTKSATMMLLK